QVAGYAACDRDREERDPVREVEASADRVDDPEPFGGDVERLVLGALLEQKPVVAAFFLDGGNDGVLDLHRRSGDDVAQAFPADVSGLAEARLRDAAGAERRALRELER